MLTHPVDKVSLAAFAGARSEEPGAGDWTRGDDIKDRTPAASGIKWLESTRRTRSPKTVAPAPTAVTRAPVEIPDTYTTPNASSKTLMSTVSNHSRRANGTAL